MTIILTSTINPLYMDIETQTSENQSSTNCDTYNYPVIRRNTLYFINIVLLFNVIAIITVLTLYAMYLFV